MHPNANNSESRQYMVYVKHITSLRTAQPFSSAKGILRPRFLIPITALALLAALLVPLLGPLADHHFAERQPGHVHIYVSGVPVQHLHDHEALHSHTNPAMVLAPFEAQSPTVESSVIFLPQEGEGLSVSTVGVTLALLTTIIALTLPTIFTILSPRSQLALRGISLSPEPPPPRLAL